MTIIDNNISSSSGIITDSITRSAEGLEGYLNSIEDPKVRAAIEEYITLLNDFKSTYLTGGQQHSEETRLSAITKLNESAKNLSELMISSDAVTGDVLKGALEEVKFTLVDLVFTTNGENGQELLSHQEKVLLGEMVIELTLMASTNGLDEQLDKTRANDLREIQKLLNSDKIDENSSFFVNDQ